MEIKKYKEFVNKSVNESINSFDEILNMPLEQRQEIQLGLEEMVELKKNESVNEGLSEIYHSIVNKFKKWLGKQAVTFLINLSQEDLSRKINMLKMLDPSDFSDIGKTDVIYLGGGIDKTSEEGAAGWRDNIEEYFGMDHVVQGQDMIDLAKDGKLNINNYPKPLIMNPMRNELVRTNDPRFSEIFRKWKSGELDKEKDHDDWKYWANVINSEIHAPDLRIVNACDTNLVKLDPGAGAGTMGEMQLSALRGLNLFVWLDNGYTVKDISPWLIPTVTKLVRNDEELKMLLDNIKANTGEKQLSISECRIKTYSNFVNENVTSIPKEQWGVHETHCCKECGCKYGDKDCPVVMGLTDQRNECVDCVDDEFFGKYEE